MGLLAHGGRSATQRTRKAWATAAIAAACIAGSAAFQAVADQTSVEELIAQLDAASFDERELASERLASAEGITLNDLETALAREDLSPEQRARLEGAAFVRFRSVPRAAMGVQFDRSFGEWVVIDRTVPGFPSNELLQSGDLIIEADGQPIVGAGAWPALRFLIIAHEPGESMRLKVRRGEELLEISVPLGSFGNLRTAELSEVDYIGSWRARRAARRLPGPGSVGREPVSAGVTLAAWREADGEAEMKANQTHGPAGTLGQGMTLLAGGQTRLGAGGDDEIFRYNQTQRRTAYGDAFWDLTPRPSERPRAVMAREQIETLKGTIEQYREAIDPAVLQQLPEQQRREYMQQQRERIALLEKVLLALRAEAAVDEAAAPAEPQPPQTP